MPSVVSGTTPLRRPWQRLRALYAETWEAGHLWPRWIFLRLLGVWFSSVFYSLWFQAPGLIGPDGLMPVSRALEAMAVAHPGLSRLWETPTVLWWLGSDNRALILLCGVGFVGSVALILNVWPRAAVALCTIAFVSFLNTLQAFSRYQSDGMLAEAGFLAFFFAPSGARPGLGAARPPSRLALFGLQWLWFRIYFESGVAKIRGRDPQWWPDLTAMDKYYENGPLPTWLSWYAQQRLPHAFHRATAFATLVVEVALVWALFLPRPAKIALCLLLTPFQLGIIATANYAFLNYLVLSLGFLLLDDRLFAHLGLRVSPASGAPARPLWRWLENAAVALQIYATAVLLPWRPLRALPQQPVTLFAPFHMANSYGLFGRMTRDRYEIEFAGSLDGIYWKPYHFRYKPQDPKAPPGIYAPYQPRFEWNLWFASLGDVQHNTWVVDCARKLLDGSPDVLALFRSDPFHGQRPQRIRIVKRRYWFSSPDEHAETGTWWQRSAPEPYGPTLERRPGGEVVVAEGG
jgi:hypothetical protein